MKRIISILLVITMLMSSAIIFASCNSSEKEDDSGLLSIVSGGLSDYTVVRGDNASDVVSAAAVTLKKAIKEKTGADLPMNTDYIPRNETNPDIPKLEILVGKTNRAEAEGLLEGLGEMQFIIKVVDKKLIICGANDKMTENAVGYFIRNYLTEKSDKLELDPALSLTQNGDYTYCTATGMTYEEMANEVYSDFLSKYWKGKWVQGSGFWDAAEILETFIDAYEATGDEKYLTYVKDYAKSFEVKNGTNWLNNEFNDDIMWICIAYLRIYNLTGEKTYYKQAQVMYDGVYARAWSDDLGGGFFWKTDKTCKNSCVNNPAAIAACYLYKITKNEKYIEQAKATIDWVVSTLYGGSGYVFDSINLADKEINRWASTYNQGTFIGACTLIHEITGDKTYLDYATDAVNYTMKNMFNYGVMNSEDGNQDLVGFKGILTRWIYRYAIYMNDLEVLEWLQLNASTAFSNANSKGLIWTAWNNKTPETPGENHVVFGYSTAVALMFNSLQWWDTETGLPEKPADKAAAAE